MLMYRVTFLMADQVSSDAAAMTDGAAEMEQKTPEIPEHPLLTSFLRIKRR